MKFIYLFDPLCGWCYGSSQGITTLAKSYAVDVYATGLFAGTGKMIDAQFANHAWTNDMKINQLTGLPFSENYHRLLLKGGAFDSLALTKACALLKADKPKDFFAVFSALQKMRYVDGLDTSDVNVVKHGLIALGYSDIADKVSDENSQNLASEWIAQGQKLSFQFGVRGVPSLIADIDSKSILIPSQFLYQDVGDVAKNIAEFLK